MRKLKAFSAVEIIIAVAVIAAVIVAIAAVIAGAYSSPSYTSQQTQASELMDEGFTAVKSIRDRDFSLLTAGAHGLQNTGNQWQLVGVGDWQNIYYRVIDIVSVDTNTKQISITITWDTEIGGSKSLSSTQIITNFRRSISVAPPPIEGQTDWSTPQIVSKTSLPTEGRDVRIHGNYAYIVTTGNGEDFLIYNITDLKNPTKVSSLNIPNDAVRMEYAEGYVYVSSSHNNELTVIDVNNPLNPTIIATVNLPSAADANGLRVDGDKLYITRASSNTSGSDELTILDISDPANPTVIGGYNPNETLYDVEVIGDYAYTTSAWDNGEVYILNVSDPSNVQSLGVIDLSGSTNGYFLGRTGKYLFIGRTDSDVYIYNILNPETPIEVNVYQAEGRVQRIIFDNSGNYAFMPNSNNYNADFEVVDILSISQPDQLDILNNSGIQYSADYDGNRELIALVGNGTNEQLILVAHEVQLAQGEDLCKVTYTIQNQWGNGFVAEVKIANVSSSEISSWKVKWDFLGDQSITNYWSVNLSQNAKSVTGENLSYNSNIAVGGTQAFGFQATYSGSNDSLPSNAFTVNGVTCVN